MKKKAAAMGANAVILEAESEPSAATKLLGAALLGMLAFYLSRFLSKERIILSSKGKWA